MGAGQVIPTCADWPRSDPQPRFAAEEGQGSGGCWEARSPQRRLQGPPILSGSAKEQEQDPTSVWASAQSSWELALSTVSPLGHPRLLLMSTDRKSVV